MPAGRRRTGIATAIIAVVTGVGLLPGIQAAGARPSSSTAPPATAAQARAALEALPVRFEANEGQFDAAVRYVARGGGYTLFLTSDEAVLSLARPGPARGENDKEGPPEPGAAGHDVVRMSLSAANPKAALAPIGRLPGVTNYLLGDDPEAWHTGVASYAGVRYQGVYPGIDLVFRQGSDAVEYDFEVAPGADPGAIALAFEGGGRPAVDTRGDLVLSPGASGQLRQSKPKLYQDVAGSRRPVAGAFKVAGGDKVGFEVGDYDHSKALVIDPVLTYSSYLAGAVGGGSVATAVATGASGAAYVTGSTEVSDFPTKPAPGAAQAVYAGRTDRFVAKFNTASSGAASLAYSTYLGGSRSESGPAASPSMPRATRSSPGPPPRPTSPSPPAPSTPAAARMCPPPATAPP